MLPFLCPEHADSDYTTGRVRWPQLKPIRVSFDRVRSLHRERQPCFNRIYDNLFQIDKLGAAKLRARSHAGAWERD